MAHTRADASARQESLTELHAAVDELERLITEAEARDQRMAPAQAAKAQELKARFPAMGGQW